MTTTERPSLDLPDFNEAVRGAPFLLWSNNLVQGRAVGNPRALYSNFAGWYTRTDQNEKLDEACKAAKFPRLEVRHRTGEINEYWHFDVTLSVYPLTLGPRAQSVFKSVSAEFAADTASAGLGVRVVMDDKGKQRTQASVRVFVAPLIAVGYTEPLQISVSGFASTHLFEALIDHIRICKEYKAQFGRIFPAQLALPLEPGELQTVGKEETTSIVPFISAHPRKLDAAYLQSLLCPESLNDEIVSQWPAAVTWAREYMAAMPAPDTEPNPTAHAEPNAADLAPDAIEKEIGLATLHERCDQIKARIDQLRTAREISPQEAARLVGVLEQRVAKIDESTPF